MSIAIRVTGVSKRYRLGTNKGLTSFIDCFSLSHRAVNTNQNEEGYWWALKNVSFQVNRGEVFGIVGKNGAGKTTLLRVLSRITHPSAGRIELYGSVSSLFHAGIGFHPELTGRENIYLSGSILGISRTTIREKLDEIVRFAEIGTFLDTPIKKYSSGMCSRLAFAIAAHLDSDIVLTDEILSVGDQYFQKKCLEKTEQFAERGRTVLWVSHNLGAIARLCGQCLWLENGGVKKIGDAREIASEYSKTVA
ncbi:MAG: ABC transporter ATP-binding protein [Deltaproteobacteria bacterium]|nr:ABC transporter ATP-binding protein [Deltaproteobacteria bacterium]